MYFSINNIQYTLKEPTNMAVWTWRNIDIKYNFSIWRHGFKSKVQDREFVVFNKFKLWAIYFIVLSKQVIVF